MARRPSQQTIAVVDSLLVEPVVWKHGYEMSRRLDIASGTLYPILMRLHDRGYLEKRWEESPLEGRPPRHLYRLTSSGRAWAKRVVDEATRPARSQPRLGTA